MLWMVLKDQHKQQNRAEAHSPVCAVVAAIIYTDASEVPVMSILLLYAVDLCKFKGTQRFSKESSKGAACYLILCQYIWRLLDFGLSYLRSNCPPITSIAYCSRSCSKIPQHTHNQRCCGQPDLKPLPSLVPDPSCNQSNEARSL